MQWIRKLLRLSLHSAVRNWAFLFQSDILNSLQSTGKDKFRPILVKFTSQAYMGATETKAGSSQHTTQIYINEHLTRQNTQIYAKARILVNQKKVIITAWISAGYVYYYRTSGKGWWGFPHSRCWMIPVTNFMVQSNMDWYKDSTPCIFHLIRTSEDMTPTLTNSLLEQFGILC